MENTLCLIKPDAVSRNLAGEILAMIQKSGLEVTALTMLHLSKKEAMAFYAVHKERPFFDSLSEYMCSGSIVAVALRGDDAIARYRTLMGATNPENALEGTIRKRFALGLEANSVHGSDGPETAATEIGFFFSQRKLVSLLS